MIVILKRRVPERQRIEVARDAGAVSRGRLHGTVALRRKAESLQGFGVELQRNRRGRADEAERFRPFEIVAIRHLEIARGGRYFAMPVAAVLDVARELVGIRRADTGLLAVFATPAGEESDPGRTFVFDDVLGVAARILCAAAVVHESG